MSAIKTMLLLVLASSGCANDAITYMHQMRPDAQCSSLQMYAGSEPDIAMCTVDGKNYVCVAAMRYMPPKCELQTLQTATPGPTPERP